MPYIIIVVLIAYALRRLTVAKSLAGKRRATLGGKQWVLLGLFVLAPPLYVVGAGAPMYWMLVALMTGALCSYVFHFEWTHPQAGEDEQDALALNDLNDDTRYDDEALVDFDPDDDDALYDLGLDDTDDKEGYR